MFVKSGFCFKLKWQKIVTEFIVYPIILSSIACYYLIRKPIFWSKDWKSLSEKSSASKRDVLELATLRYVHRTEEQQIKQHVTSWKYPLINHLALTLIKSSCIEIQLGLQKMSLKSADYTCMYYVSADYTCIMSFLMHLLLNGWLENISYFCALA